MEAKIINLEEWVSSGGGGFGESFYNKTDDSVILKLNKPSVSAGTAGEARWAGGEYLPDCHGQAMERYSTCFLFEKEQSGEWPSHSPYFFTQTTRRKRT